MHPRVNMQKQDLVHEVIDITVKQSHSVSKGMYLFSQFDQINLIEFIWLSIALSE